MFFTILSIVIIITHIFLCFRNLVYGYAFMLSIHQIFPTVFRFGRISMNTALILILFSFIIINFLKKRITINTKYLYTIKSFALPLLIITIFAPLDFKWEFNAWLQFLITEILPSIILLIIIRNVKDFKIVLSTLLCSYIISGVYGILTYIWHMNPIFDLFNLYYGGNISFTGNGEEQIRGALTGAASGNTSGPLPWGQCSLVILILACFLPKNYKNGWLSNIVIILALLNCFLCGKRSIILPMIIIISYYIITRYILNKREIKKTIFIFSITILGILTFIPKTGYIKNIETAIFFWDDKLAEKNNIGGSNSTMRLKQFNYVNRMIASQPLCGLGYDYTGYYFTKHGKHPIMLGFESIYFQIIAESGIIGLLIWGLFFYRNYRITIYGFSFKKDALFIHVSYLLSLILTGIQSSIFIYLIFIALIQKNKEKKIQSQTIQTL